MRRRIRFQGDKIEKRYERSHLLVDDATLQTRITCITALSRAHEAIPLTTFRVEGEALVLEQARVSPNDRPSPGDPRVGPALRGLAALLDAIAPHIVHGDVCRKNVVFDGEQLHLVDWEPALRQLRDGRATLLYTEPYISLGDIAGDTLTTETDKLGFFFLCLTLRHGPGRIDQTRALVRARRTEQRCMTPIDEGAFMALSFAELNDLAERSGDWRVSG
jgi:hypothetical protein